MRIEVGELQSIFHEKSSRKKDNTMLLTIIALIIPMVYSYGPRLHKLCFRNYFIPLYLNVFMPTIFSLLIAVFIVLKSSKIERIAHLCNFDQVDRKIKSFKLTNFILLLFIPTLTFGVTCLNSEMVSCIDERD